MAITALKSPWYFSGPNLELRTERAVDSQTWKAGEWCKRTSTGKLIPVSNNKGSVYGIFADSQSSSTSASDVRVYRIPSSTTRFVGYLASGGSDKQALQTDVGRLIGMGVASNVMVLTGDSTPVFHITERFFKVEPFKNDSSTAPYKVIFSVRDTALVN